MIMKVVKMVMIESSDGESRKDDHDSDSSKDG